MRKEIINIATELWGTPETNVQRSSWKINDDIEFDMWNTGSYGFWKNNRDGYIFHVSFKDNIISFTIL